MNHQPTQPFRKSKSFIGSVALILILALVVTRALKAQQDAPDEANAPQAFSSTGTINFQGELTDNSSGATIPDGDYNLRFAIYDAQ